MKPLTIIFILLWSIGAIVTSAQRQPIPSFYGGAPENFGRELFSYRIYNFADLSDRSKSVAEFHFALVNDLLPFVKSAEADFYSIYTLEAIVYNSQRESIAYMSRVDTVRVADYAATNDRADIKRRVMRFLLPPGEYEYRVQLTDVDQQVILRRDAKMKLADFSADKLQMSDIVFADELECDRRQFKANLRNSFHDENSQFAVFFEIYAPSSADSLTIEYTVRTRMGAELLHQRNQRASSPKSEFCLVLPERLRQPGDYLFDVSVQQGNKIVKSQQAFSILWGNLAIRSENLALAIEQLSLIAKGDVIKQMRAAQGEEQQRLYDEFWRQRDPTPGTPENELKQVFFERIDFANRHFSEARSNREGWRSDRGRVYIRNGPPDEIEKMPTEPNMPAAEIWYYRKLQRRYIFSDPEGSGEYRLVKVE